MLGACGGGVCGGSICGGVSGSDFCGQWVTGVVVVVVAEDGGGTRGGMKEVKGNARMWWLE